jgi:phospholipid/cholesterol/gamma-HCH transport system permease protein
LTVKFNAEDFEHDIVLRWLKPLGKSILLLSDALRPQSFRKFDWELFASKCVWLGPQSLPLVSLSAIFIGLTLTLQAVLEMRYLRSQDLSGAVIAIGLLRELGPITVSMAWAARVTAHLCAEGRYFGLERSDADYASNFVLPNLLAGYLMSIPLAAYGLVVGFLTAALFAPTLGVSSTNDFMETARLYIRDKDVMTYFVKLILINPTLAVLIGSAFGREDEELQRFASANAVTALFIAGFITNWLFTYAVYGLGYE